MAGRSLAFLTTAVLLAAVAAGQTLPSHTLLGKVSDPSGRALPGASVELTTPSSAASARTTTTDQQGRYRIEKVVPGAYVLTVRLPGFGSVIRDVEIGGGPQDFEYNAELKPLASGAPVAPPSAEQPTRRVICGMTVITPPAGVDPGIQGPKTPPNAVPAKPTMRTIQPTMCWEPPVDTPTAPPKR